MQPQETRTFENDADAVRRSIHDVAAAVISVRALAETLAEHLPTLVAMSRSGHSAKQAHIPPATLDSLPALPAEIIKLCAIAREGLQGLGNESGATAKPKVGSTHGSTRTADTRTDSPPKRTGRVGARILLVDDDESVRYVMLQTLQAQGCQVASARDGQEALQLLDKTDFDLVLMDLRMPGISGWEATERLRAKESTQGRYTRIVGLTASPLLQDQIRARVAGIDDVLIKPLDETALRRILSRFT